MSHRPDDPTPYRSSTAWVGVVVVTVMLRIAAGTPCPL